MRLKVYQYCEKDIEKQFQFQTGSIKSPDTTDADDRAYVSFNSKLVRLKGAYAERSLRRVFMFQFQTGSIKSAPPIHSYEVKGQFQFQTGSIKSHLPLHQL